MGAIVMLIPLATIKQHLRIDDDPNPGLDAELERLLEAATDHASQYIGRPIPWENEDDGSSSSETMVFPKSVEHAVLLIIGDLYEHREGQFVGVSAQDNPAVERLLHFYRVGLGV